MSFERINPDGVDFKEANADLSAAQFKIVKLLTTNKIDLNSAAALAYGILQDKPKSGEIGTVARCGSGGISRCIVDGSGTSIAIGDFIKSNGSGVGVQGATDKDRVIGRALEAATAANVIIAVDLSEARDLSV